MNESLELRLVDSQYPASGMVVGRVRPTDDWGAICGEDIDRRDTDVVCRHLGFLESIPVIRQFLDRTLAPSSTLVSAVGCFGSETDISQCPLVSGVGRTCDQFLYVESVAGLCIVLD